MTRLVRRGDPVARPTPDANQARTPWPLRAGLDALLLAVAAISFLLTSRSGYQVVVVPEGVPVTSVNYAALLAPALAWPGLALLCWRLTALYVGRRARTPATDPEGRMNDLRRATLQRRRWKVALGATGLSIAAAVAISTAVFTSTYDTQGRLDVALTVGSDVAATLPPDAPRGLNPISLSSVPGIRHVEAVQHRLTYIGTDLQDLYGINPETIGKSAPLLDAFTPGTTIRASLDALARTRDGALVSQETLHDYQLRNGDLIRLRLRNAVGDYRTVDFHIVGVITEFATAPRDSFVVANASYITATTGSAASQTLLITTSHPGNVATAIRRRLPATAAIADRTAPNTVTSASGLAATDLSGLAHLGISFGFILALASGALVLLIGQHQRHRSQTMLAILGATAHQRKSFTWTDARAILFPGVLGGVLTGSIIAYQLIKILTGIFDPAPAHPTIPWAFITALISAIAAALGSAAWLSNRRVNTVKPASLRDL